MGFPPIRKTRKWCMECHAFDGGAGSSFKLRSRTLTSLRFDNVLGGTNVRWFPLMLNSFSLGNWRDGKRVCEVLAILRICKIRIWSIMLYIDSRGIYMKHDFFKERFSTCRWFLTPLNVFGSNPFKGLFARSRLKRFGKQQNAASSIVVIRFPAKFNTTRYWIWNAT